MFLPGYAIPASLAILPDVPQDRGNPNVPLAVTKQNSVVCLAW